MIFLDSNTDNTRNDMSDEKVLAAFLNSTEGQVTQVSTLAAMQTLAFQKLCKLLIKKGVITADEFKQLVMAAVDEFENAWSDSDEISSTAAENPM